MDQHIGVKPGRGYGDEIVVTEPGIDKSDPDKKPSTRKGDGDSDQATPAPTPSPAPVKRKLTAEELARGGFTSTIPFEDMPADCLVICCSDPRFERQTEDLMGALGFVQPHYLQVPSGPAVFGALVAAKNFLPKSMLMLLKRAVELTNAPTIVIVGHEDCGGYKVGNHRLVQEVSRRLAGKSVGEIQETHLEAVGRDIHAEFERRVQVRAFYADVIETREGQRINFREVGNWATDVRRGQVSSFHRS